MREGEKEPLRWPRVRSHSLPPSRSSSSALTLLISRPHAPHLPPSRSSSPALTFVISRPHAPHLPPSRSSSPALTFVGPSDGVRSRPTAAFGHSSTPSHTRSQLARRSPHSHGFMLIHLQLAPNHEHKLTRIFTLVRAHLQLAPLPPRTLGQLLLRLEQPLDLAQLVLRLLHHHAKRPARTPVARDHTRSRTRSREIFTPRSSAMRPTCGSGGTAARPRPPGADRSCEKV